MRETESLDFVEAIEWLAERFRVTLEYEETSPQVEESRRAPRAAVRAARAGDGVLRAAALGVGRRRAGACISDEPRPLEPVCREFRLGLSPGDGLARKAQEKGFTPRRAARPPASRTRAAATTSRRG